MDPFAWTFEDDDEWLRDDFEVLEYEGENSGHKRKVNDDAPESYNPMLKRVRRSVVENSDNTQSTDYIYGQEKQNHFASPVSNSESLRQHFPNFETVFDAAALTTLTQSWDFEEDEMSLTCADIDVGDSFTFCQIPTENTCGINSELTFPERQVEEKESAANSADFISAGNANNSEFMGFDVHSAAMDQIPCHNMEHFAPSTDGNLAAGSSASIMDLSKLEEFLFTDIDENDIANIPNLDSFLLDFTLQLDEDIANLEHSSILGGGACSGDDINYGQFINCSSESAMLTSIPAEILELPGAPAAINLEHHVACLPEAHLSAPAANSVDPELYNGVICCVLNMEDTEIPCNDNADFTLFSPHEIPRNNYASTTQLKKALYRADNIKETPKSSEMIKSDILSELGLNLPFIKRGD